MQRIYGKDLGELDGLNLEEAKRQWRIELEKVLDLGYSPVDSRKWNVLFDEKKERIFLIDLAYWNKSGSKKLNKFYKALRNGIYYQSYV